jgi:carbonic anhydrase
VGEHPHKNFEINDCTPIKKPPILTFGDIKARLYRIHVHPHSEHKIEGYQFDGEVHLIHKIIDPQSGSDLLVVGIFIDKKIKPRVGEKEHFFAAWNEHSTNAGLSKSAGGTISLDPEQLEKELEGTKNWFRYEGSLTSPPYSENVSWIVLNQPIGIHSKAYEQLKDGAMQHTREVQCLNRRFVLRNFEPVTETANSKKKSKSK